MACGVAAGMAASFSAPLAGIIFACEEVYRRMTFKILVPALTASVTASVFSVVCWGSSRCCPLVIPSLCR